METKVATLLIGLILVFTPCYGIDLIGPENGLKTINIVGVDGRLGWYLGDKGEKGGSFFSPQHNVKMFTAQAVQLCASVGEIFASSNYTESPTQLKIDAVLDDKIVIGLYAYHHIGSRTAYATSNCLEVSLEKKIFVGLESETKVGPKIIEIKLIKISGPKATLSIRSM